MSKRTKQITLYAMLLALSMVLSFIESMVSLSSALGIPGIKIGLANIVTVIGIYSIGIVPTLIISFTRIMLSAATFGNFMTISYSIAGFFLSFTGMLLLKSLKFDKIPVSITGGVLHNLAQVLVAIVLLQNTSFILYFPVLFISGTVAGIIIGIVSGMVSERITGYLKVMS